MTNTEQARSILTLLETNGWVITSVAEIGDPDETTRISGNTAEERVELALIEVESVDESLVMVRRERDRRMSFITLNLGNDQDMLNEYGSMLDSVFEDYD